MLGVVKLTGQQSFRGADEFTAFLAGRPEACDVSAIAAAVEGLKQRGRALTRRFGWARATIVGPNYREDIQILGLPGRVHALLDVMDTRLDLADNPDVLWLDSTGRLVRPLREAFPGMICCAPDAAAASGGDPRRISINPCTMGFVDQSFDAVVFNENLHVQPDIAGALEECARVLRPGGLLLATFPFACSGAPEPFASDQSRGGSRSPVILGWEIIDIARQSGFGDCSMEYVSDLEKGIIGGDLDGIFVFAGRAANQKPA